MNLVEKILAKASGKKEVYPGDIVEARIDVAMMHDLTGPLTIEQFNKIGTGRVWDASRIVIIFDHLVPASTVEAAELQKVVRKFVEEQGIKNFYDVGRGGISHQVMVEKGFVVPGEVIVGADSHTCTYGALGAFSTGIGSTEMAAVFVTGKLWFKVPKVIKICIEGKLQDLVTPKDLILSIIGKLGVGGATYKGIEFSGALIKDMSIDGRMTLCNMVVEAGAKAGIIEADEKVFEYLKGRTKKNFMKISSDSDARYEEEIELEFSKLIPQIACPPSVDNVKPVVEVEGEEIDQAFIGSCTNGRLEDLRLAAKILKGKKINPNVRLIIIPASQEIYAKAIEEGLLETFLESGGIVCNANCGPCLGGHMGLLGENEVCISTSNRNFIGRMGSKKASIYLASPATVAASAIEGRITDPRNLEGQE
ncbi:MAG: homoaconitase large subunit [Candidatus Bathyarchaeia archaeon]